MVSICFSQQSCVSGVDPLENKHKVLVAFKSDMSKAYRLCPMHPLWQLKQVVTTGYLTSEQKAAGEVETLVRTVDRNNNFGGEVLAESGIASMGLSLGWQSTRKG